MTRCRKNEDENDKRMKIADLSEIKRMKITLVEKTFFLSFPSFWTPNFFRAFGAYFLIKSSEIHLKSVIFFSRAFGAHFPCKPLKYTWKETIFSRAFGTHFPYKTSEIHLKSAIFFARLRRAIKDILFAFSAKIAYGSIKISAKDENYFGQDEIDIMEKNEDENKKENMKMTNSLKNVRYC